MGFEALLEPVFGEPKAEWSASTATSPTPLRPHVLHVYALDPSRLTIHVTDFHSSTREALRSVQQLEDLTGPRFVRNINLLEKLIKNKGARAPAFFSMGPLHTWNDLAGTTHTHCPYTAGIIEGCQYAPFRWELKAHRFVTFPLWRVFIKKYKNLEKRCKPGRRYC